MALPGETSCRKVADCAPGTWSDIPVDGNTVYVDQSYALGMSDGSVMHPWTTIQAALDAAPSDALVAVAEGTYLESLLITKPVSLWGSCPDLVEVSGSPSVHIQTTSVEIHRLGVTGGTGFLIERTGQVLLESVWIHDTTGEGVNATDLGLPTKVTLRDSLIDTARGVAVSGWGADFAVERTVLRGTQPYAGGDFGRGISAAQDANTGLGCQFTINRVLVEDMFDVGIGLFGCDITIEDTLVRRTASNQIGGTFGSGIEAPLLTNNGTRSYLRLRRSVIEDSHFCGVCTYDSELEMEATTVRDTHPEESTLGSGYGVRMRTNLPNTDVRPRGTIVASSIHRSHLFGLGVVGAEMEVEAVLIRETAPAEVDQKFGRGIGVEPSDTFKAGSIVVRGAVIEQSHEVGLLVLGSHGEIDSVLVSDVKPRPADDAYGAGIVFHLEPVTGFRSDGIVTRSVVQDAYAAGLAALGADVVASDVITTGIRPQVDAKDFGDGIVASAWVQFLDELFPTSMQVTRATVTGNARAGIASFGASVEVGQSMVDCNTIHLDAERLEHLPAVFTDGGLNVCGCGAETITCKVLSANLEPPFFGP
jgi:hypothetical protein